MSSPVRPPLTVTDGTTEVRPTNKIVFDAADGFTVTKNGNDARIDFTGGGSATLTSTYVGFGSGSNVLTGDATFTWDNTNKKLTLTSTDAAADAAPEIEFYRNSASPASDDKLGGLLFTGEDSAGAKVTYAQMYAQIDNAVSGSHDGRLVIDVVSNAASPINVFRADKDEVIINDVSFALDTRIESNGNDKAIFVDGSADAIGIMGDANSDSDVTIHHTNSSSTDATLRLISTDSGANDAPRLELYRNSASPADNDNLGEIVFSGENDAGSKVYKLASIRVDIPDVSAGSEDGWLQFGAMDDGTFIENMLTVRGDARQVVVNEDGNSTNFRVQGNSAPYLLFGNTTNEFVSINGSGAASGLADNEPKLQVEGSITGKMPIVVQNSNVTLTRAGLSGQTYVCTDGGTTALTMPLGAEQGDYFYFVSTSGSFQIVVDVGTQTLNGGTSALTRGTNNEVYTVICVEDNKFILSNPA